MRVVAARGTEVVVAGDDLVIVMDDAEPGRDPAPSGSERPGHRGYRLGLLALLVVTGAWRLVAMVQWSWMQDDWAYVAGGHETPFWPYVTQVYTGHLMPGQFALVWGITRAAPLDHGWAVASLWTLSMASLAVWALLLRRLLGERWAALIPLVPLALASGFVPIVLWFAAGLQAFSLQLALGLTLLASVGWAERGSRRSLGLTVAAYVAGLLLWEKSLLVLVPVLGLSLLLARDPSGRLLRRRLAGLSVALGVPAAAYTAVYLAATRDAGEQAAVGAVRSWGATASFVWVGLSQHLVPALMGGPWRDAGAPGLIDPVPPTWAQWFLLAALAVALPWALARRRLGWIPVGTATVYWCLSMGLVLSSSRFEVLGNAAGLDSRYQADALAVALLMGTLLLVPARSERGVLAPDAGPATRPWVAPAVAAVLAASCLYSSSVLWDAAAPVSPRPWVEALVGDAATAGASSVVDSRPPANVLAAALFPVDGRLSRMLSPLELPVRWDGATTGTVLTADPAGHLVPAAFAAQVLGRPGPVPGCGYLVEPGRTVVVPLTAPAFRWDWGVVVGGFSRDGGRLVVASDHAAQEVPFGRGTSSTSLIVRDSAASLRLSSTAGSGAICIDRVTLGTVSPAPTSG